MGAYFIKKHYNTGEDYPGPQGIHFTRRARKAAEAFAAGQGFLLYEAGSSQKTGLAGAKAVYGYGHVESGPLELWEPRWAGGKEYTSVVKVRVEKALKDRKRGIPLTFLRDQYGVQMRPSLGGTVEVTEKAFRELKEHLDTLWEGENQ